MKLRRRAQFELLDVPRRNMLGEGPWWSVQRQELLWVDIPNGRVQSASLDGRSYAEWHVCQDVGFVVPTQDGTFLVGLREGLGILDPATGLTTLSQSLDAGPDVRINDGKTDRRGRLWFGTMHDSESEAIGALYRVGNGASTRILDGVTTSNGLGWSPDSAFMYYTDSMVHAITRYHFDAESGSISQPELFAADEGGRVPDGLTVDSEGGVWAAKWDGGCIVHYAPDGSIVEELILPVARPTSCMFVGDDLATLAVTSAQSEENPSELDGAVFLLNVGVRGIPESPAINVFS